VKDESTLFDALTRYAQVLLQHGRTQLDADEDEYEYVRLRRFGAAVLESIDQALGLAAFSPSGEPRESDGNEHDPGIVLVELLADVANALADYGDRVAAEARLRSRRRAVAAAGLLVVLAWCWRRRR
jgi:hypothetical protein